MKQGSATFDVPTEANTISVGFDFDGNVRRNTFTLFGKMWEDHKLIEIKLRHNGALIAKEPQLGVYLVLSSLIVKSVDDFASDFVVRRQVAPQIIEWVRKGAHPLVEDDLYTALKGGVRGYETRLQLRRNAVACVVEASREITTLLDEVIELGKARP